MHPAARAVFERHAQVELADVHASFPRTAPAAVPIDYRRMTSCFIAAAIERYGVHGANELIAIATAHMNAKGE